MILDKINKLSTKLVSLIQQVNSTDIMLDNSRMWLDLLKQRFNRLSKEVDAQLVDPPRPTMEH